MATEQDTIIGKHPSSSDFLGIWLNHTDMTATPKKKHRVLAENNGTRTQAIEQVAAWVFDHLVSDFMKSYLSEQRAILSQHEFEKVAEQCSLIPTLDTTQKCVVTEVVLIEYLKKTTGYTPIVHKLHFNPNTDQSMKGDDCLLFDPNDIKKLVIYGESKFRGTPDKQAINEIVGNLQNNKRLPVSLTFVASLLATHNELEKAKEVLEVLKLIKDGKTPVNNAGFLLSMKSSKPSSDTKSMVENNLTTTNPNLVFISLGIDDPSGFVTDVMDKVNDKLKNI